MTLLFVGSASAQLTITTGQTAQQLAEVIAGPGVTVSGATITGSPDAIGAFVTGATASGLGIASGVGLSNGNIVDAAQDEFNFASTTLGTPGSPYLDNLTGEVLVTQLFLNSILFQMLILYNSIMSSAPKSTQVFHVLHTLILLL